MSAPTPPPGVLLPLPPAAPYGPVITAERRPGGKPAYRDGNLYVFAAPHAVKVGVTSKPIEERRRGVEMACGARVRVVGSFEGLRRVYVVERVIHERLGEYRTFGEWFACDPDYALEVATGVVDYQWAAA